MRCFVALPLPETVKKLLGDLYEPVKGLRWQKADQLHITLKFLGDVSGDKVQALQEGLGLISLPAFSLSLKEPGYFPKGRKPRVLWAGVEENAALTQLRDKVESICVAEGFEADDRPFKPHVTLARSKGASKDKLDSFVNNHQKFEVRDVPVEEFVLYESRLHSSGAEHIKVKTFGLNK